MIHSGNNELAMYTKAVSSSGKLVAKTNADKISKQLGPLEHVEATLIVGDEAFDEGMTWTLGSLSIDPYAVEESKLHQLPLPRRLYKKQLEPEIVHQFVTNIASSIRDIDLM